MKKQISTTLVALSLAVALALPTTVQAASFNPGQALSNLKNRIGNGVQRLYLRAIPGPKSGKAVLKQSTAAMENVKSFRYDMIIDGSVEQKGEQLGTAKFTLAGPAEMQDLYDPNTAKQQLTVTGEVQVEGVQISGAGEMIIDGQKAAYMKITEIPLPMQQYRGLKNQWMKFDTTKMQTTTTRPQITDQMMKRYRKAIDKLYDEATVSNAKKEKWEDESVFVLDVEFGADALMNYIDEVYAITAESDSDVKPMAQQEKDQLRKMITAMAPFKSTMRINRSNFQLRQVEMPIALDVKKITEVMEADKPAARRTNLNTMPFDKIMMNVTMKFDDYNEPVEITAPTDARPAEEVMMEISRGMMAPTPYRGTVPTQPLPSGLTPEEQEMMRQYGY